MHGILALFVRSLREQVRGTSFAWMRAGVAVVVLITMVFRARWSFGSAAGMEFFAPFAVYNGLMIMIAATSYFASAITEEKEEQTLGLLRMTNLSALAILFGKGTSRMLGGMMLLLVQFPFALLAVTLGGMAPEQIAITYVLLTSFLFFCANLGLFASVIARNNTRAALLTVFLGWLYLWSPSILGWFADFTGFIGASNLSSTFSDIQRGAVEYSGFRTFFQAISIGWDAASWRGTSLAFGIAGLCFFALAWASFGRFAADPPETKPRAVLNKSVDSAPSRAGRAWPDAIAWKDQHFIHGGGRTAGIKGVIYFILAIWIAGTMAGNRWRATEVTIWTIFTLSTLAALIETAVAGSRVFRIEVRGQTLGDLYVLPQDINALIRSKRRAVLYSLIPIGVFVASSLVCGLPSLLDAAFDSTESFLVFAQVAILFPLEFVFHYRLAAWFSLRLKWGGFPAALVTSFFGHLVGIPILAASVQIVFGIPLIMAIAGMNAGLGAAIRRMLTERAADA
jgi:hypothetical protein